jgi:hypothetical protein
MGKYGTSTVSPPDPMPEPLPEPLPKARPFARATANPGGALPLPDPLPDSISYVANLLTTVPFGKDLRKGSFSKNEPIPLISFASRGSLPM